MNVNPWLLPDGVEEILPAQAQAVEGLRRRLLDLYASWGYELIMPPLMEFTDSLLSGVSSDLHLLTLKVTDQLSGQLMGLRPDITPQAARIDAHSYVKSGPSRLCYADHVLHAKPKSPLAIRTPLQVGVELFGEARLDADIEVIALLLSSLNTIDVTKVTLDLGHVGICRALLEPLALSAEQQSAFFELLQSKDSVELEQWLTANTKQQEMANALSRLPTLCGDHSILQTAREQLALAPAAALAAIDQLEAIAEVIAGRYPQVNLYFDLGEFRSYQYHTGIVFAAYAEGFGDAIANGGRYDHIGEAYGRARPATGFGLNLSSVLSLVDLSAPVSGIYAPAVDDPDQWQQILDLRAQGERVVCGLSQQPPDYAEIRCDRVLIFDNGQYQVKAL
ncbi:MAG: ATP phosphoribosyltransferase regulatory subunit [Pseudomonadota bacterium]